MLLPLLASASCAGSLRADIRQSDVFTLGRMSCAICHDLLTTHLTRRLEDKLIHHSIDFRPFHIHMDARDIHQNSAVPEAFMSLLCVAETTLPMKGTGHKASRVAEHVDTESVNVWCNSALWRKQTLSTNPRQLPESEYITTSQVTSHEGRRNLTDFQETCQWLGGQDVPLQICRRLLGLSARFVLCRISSPHTRHRRQILT